VVRRQTRSGLDALRPYVSMARVDHWVKNAFMLLGIVVASMYRPEAWHASSAFTLVLAFFATCAIASSNYVLNEYLDAPFDRLHPTKFVRPAAAGEVHGRVVYLCWGGLAIVGILLANQINPSFTATALLFWIMGMIYNVEPVRAKDVAYVDVLVESINNPIRLALGWFALVPDLMPPLSIAIAFWMIGAFFMAAKRFAEYRRIADPERASLYRTSFKTYDEARLLGSMFFYAATGAVFGGVFLVRYKLELIFCVPAVTIFLGLYAWLTMRPDSPVQAPEKLHKESALMLSAAMVLVTFVLAMFMDVPALYTLFNVDHAGIEPLWRVGG
jgi:4-hydroxybenzoate polyprenyltransferase